MTEVEQSIIMEMISSAGESKVKSFEALKKVKTKEYDEAS
ncbi:cellobiose-specific phosphotransferase system component IIA [Clostridium beijerinckii]|nr:PTS lactose/cellobiose transporter subunit IIA [Clostridium beijerinckii]NYC52894.1 cellobiose-specific phosphotransferase system component IIA [Clostridium beijerinckii]